MSSGTVALASSRPGALPLLVGAGVAIAIGVSLGNPTPFGTWLLGLFAATAVFATILPRPFVGYAILVGSSVMLIAVGSIGGRSANAFDALLIPVLLGTYLGWGARAAREEERLDASPAAEQIRVATRKLTSAVLVYFSIAALSLIIPAVQGRPNQVVESGLKLVRAAQGLWLFPLGLIWLRTEKHIQVAVRALFLGLLLFAVINGFALASGTARRAGLVWYATEPLWSIASPIEASAGLLMLWVVAVARQATHRQASHFFWMPLIIAMLVLTLARSGLLAWLVFTTLSLGASRHRTLLAGAALLAAAIFLMPRTYWERMIDTISLARGSFDTFSALIRLYGWQAAWRLFMDHPIFGVGYLGYKHFSAQYNDLKLVIGTTESYFLETATGMGIIGLAALGIVITRMYQLGRTIRRVTPRKSLGHQLATYHPAYVTALLVANLTADNFVGIVGLSQVAIWHALMVRAGHLAARDRPPT